MSTSMKVLTATEVAEIDRKNHNHQAIQPVEVDNLIILIRALRADNTRLKGLIEGMGHEARCHFHFGALTRAVMNVDGNCNCVKSKVEPRATGG